jgi:hypothetical protein
MVQTFVVAGSFGAVAGLAWWWRARRAEELAAERREQLAVIVMYGEMTAAIEALDLALRDDGSKWVVSMSESRTLSEAWRDHGEALIGLGSQQWEVLSEAVTAVAPSYGLGSGNAQVEPEELRRVLTERRQRLIEGARVLRDMHQTLVSSWPAEPTEV